MARATCCAAGSWSAARSPSPPGQRVLDVGCGPGFYVAELLEEVGPEGSVVGVDGRAGRCSPWRRVAARDMPT